MSRFTAPRPLPVVLSRKPRNPFVGPALLRQAGRHGIGPHGQRQSQQRALQRELRQIEFSHKDDVP